MIQASPVLLFVLFLNLYVGIHGFLFLRAVAGKPRGGRGVPWFFLLLYCIVFLSAAFIYAGIRFERGLRSVFSLASSYWGMAVFLPPLIALDFAYFVRFIFRLVLRARKKIPKNCAAGFWGPAFTVVAHAGVFVFVSVFMIYGSWHARNPGLTEYGIKTEKPLPGGRLEVILVSDIHIGALVNKKRLAAMVEKINALDGDIVLIAGDILDRELEPWDAENLGEEFGRLEARLGVWAIPGNHDNYGGGLKGLDERLASSGIELLEDEAAMISDFYLIGRKDRGRSSGNRKSIAELSGGLDKSRLLVLMDHQPYDLGEAEAAGIDLQVSGHTHNGQIWPGPLVTNRIYENDYGLLYKGKSAFVVSSGYGVWGPSLRVGTRSEIVRITLSN